MHAFIYSHILYLHLFIRAYKCYSKLSVHFQCCSSYFYYYKHALRYLVISYKTSLDTCCYVCVYTYEPLSPHYLLLVPTAIYITPSHDCYSVTRSTQEHKLIYSCTDSTSSVGSFVFSIESCTYDDVIHLFIIHI